MRVLVQRVASASVTTSAGKAGQIGPGLLLLVGFRGEDGEAEISWMANKIVGLRIFADDSGKMNRALNEVGGSILVVSQFTLYGDARKGRRPSFVHAARPDRAHELYLLFVDALRERCAGDVETGVFGGNMMVESVNAGPVTLWLDR